MSDCPVSDEELRQLYPANSMAWLARRFHRDQKVIRGWLVAAKIPIQSPTAHRTWKKTGTDAVRRAG